MASIWSSLENLLCVLENVYSGFVWSIFYLFVRSIFSQDCSSSLFPNWTSDKLLYPLLKVSLSLILVLGISPFNSVIFFLHILGLYMFIILIASWLTLLLIYSVLFCFISVFDLKSSLSSISRVTCLGLNCFPQKDVEYLWMWCIWNRIFADKSVFVVTCYGSPRKQIEFGTGSGVLLQQNTWKCGNYFG